MRQLTHQLRVRTRGKGLYEITGEVAAWVAREHAGTGLLTVFIRHTSASLAIQENADPDVVQDLNDFFGRVAPDADPAYRHTAEGPDDMSAHIRSALTQTQLSIPVLNSGLALGTWQGIYVFEHRAEAQTRNIALHMICD